MNRASRARRRGLRVTFAALAVAALAGCWLQPTTDLHPGDSMIQQMRDSLQAGHDVRLADLTDFEWETVSVFWQGNAEEWVREETGADITLEDGFVMPEYLLVFCGDGALVWAQGLPMGSVYAARHHFSSDAVLLSTGEFHEPSGAPVEPACSEPGDR